jgi:hypothetical protein
MFSGTVQVSHQVCQFFLSVLCVFLWVWLWWIKTRLWDSLSELRSLLVFFPSVMTSHSKIAQFNWECIGPFTVHWVSCRQSMGGSCHSAGVLISSINEQVCCMFCMLLFNSVSYAFLLLCMLCSVYSVFIVPTGILPLPWLRLFRAFSSVVRQMPGYNSQRRGTVRTLPN